MRKSLGVTNLRDHKIAIIGAGNAGVLMSLIIKYLDGQVTLFNRGVEKLEFLKDKHIFATEDLRLINESIHFINKFDAALVTTTFLNENVLTIATNLVKPGQPIILFGGTKAGQKMNNSDVDIDNIRRNEKTKLVTSKDSKEVVLVGTYGSTLDDFSAVLNLLEKEEDFPVEKLIEHSIDSKDLLTTLKRLANGNHYNKIIVKYSNNG